MNSPTYRRLLGAMLLTCLVGSPLTAAFGPKKEYYYTRVNIWYERPDRIYSTNYHKGSILPVGTRVKVLAQSDEAITFLDEATSQTYTIEFVRRHSKLTPQEYFERHFSEKSVLAEGGAFSRFTNKEKANIKAGTVVPGMSAPAVVMACGYPPSHRTPDLGADAWVYWSNRIMSFKIVFKEGKVVDAGRAAP
jgi:hypothetical protein